MKNDNLELLFNLNPDATFDQDPWWVFAYHITWVFTKRRDWWIKHVTNRSKEFLNHDHSKY